MRVVALFFCLNYTVEPFPGPLLISDMELFETTAIVAKGPILYIGRASGHSSNNYFQIKYQMPATTFFENLVKKVEHP